MNRRNIRFLVFLCLFLCGWGGNIYGQCATNTQSGTFCNTRSATFAAQYNADQGCGTDRVINPYSPGEYFRMPVLLGGCYTVSTCGSSINTQIMAFQGFNTVGPFSYNDDNGPVCSGNQASITFVPNFTDYTRVDVRQFNCQPGGTSSITVRIRQNNNLTITSSAADICEGQTRTLTATPARVTATPLVGSGDAGTFSGTGVSGTTFTAPAPTGSSQLFTNTYTFGYCTRTQIIRVFRSPSTSNAGANQTVCTSSTTLSATSPSTGTGTWSVVSGSGTFANANNPTTTVTGLSNGANVFRWRITNGPCTASMSDVTISVVPCCPAPSPTSQPVSATVCPNTNASFTGSFSGADSTRWQISTDGGSTWNSIVDGTPYSGTTTNTLAINPASTVLDGNAYRIVGYACSPVEDSASAAAFLTTSDTTSPTAVCQNVTVQLDPLGAGSITTSFINNGSADNCGIDTLFLSQSNFACQDIGNVNVTLTVVDSSGNTGTCIGVVTVIDTVSPVASCQNAQVHLDASGNATVNASLIDNGSSDQCGLASLSLSQSVFDCSDLGMVSVTLTAADSSGNTSICTATITISDTTSPVVVCQNITVQLDGAGNASITANDLNAGASDACGIASISASQTSFDCSHLGSNAVNLTVVDSSGNSSSCTATVMVMDTIPPVITCPANAVVNNAVGQCGANVTYTAPSTSDNCSAVSSRIAGLGSGAFFPVGITTESYTVSDGAGNSDTCSFTVKVLDVEVPTITCPASVFVNNDSSQCSAVINYANPTVTDNCPATTFTLVAGSPSGSAFAVGTTTVSFVAIDSDSNSASCSFTVRVFDVEAPVITCPSAIITDTDSLSCDAVVNYLVPVGSDNCPGATVTQTVGLGSGATFPLGVTTEKYQVRDSSGNTVSCQFTVTVRDNEAPQAICKNDTLYLNAAGNAVLRPGDINNGSSDACGIASIALNDSLFDCGDLGMNPVVLTVNDVNGNTGNCAADVWVKDSIAPVATCRDTIVVFLDSTGVTSISATFANLGSTDNCTVDSVWLNTSVFGCNEIGWNTNWLQVADQSGNRDSCSIQVEVNDVQAPQITCPANITLFTSSVDCDAPYTFAAPGYVDNCAQDTLIQTAGLPSGSAFPVGTTTNSFTAFDQSGNFGTCSFTVTVLDTVQPRVICPNDTVLTNDMGVCGATFTYGVPAGTDNCVVTTARIAGAGSGALFPVGIQTETYVATDASGYTDTCSFTLTVMDMEAPVWAGCPTDTVLAADSSLCGTIFNFVAPSVTDNCALDSVSFNLSSGDTVAQGVFPARFVAHDIYGNVDSCTFNITVQPTALDLQVALQTYSCGFNVSCAGDSNGVATTSISGGCEPYSYLWSMGGTSSVASGLSAGAYSVTVTDGNGNTDTVSFQIMEPAPLAIDSTTLSVYAGGANVSCVDATDGSIALSVVGGCANYNYFWSTGDTTAMISGLGAGAYGVTITDQNGCAVMDSIILTAPDSLLISLMATADTCLLGNGTAMVMITGGNPGYQILWSNGATTSAMDSLLPGMYGVTVTDVNGCMTMDSILVPAFRQPVSLISGPDEIGLCLGQTAMLEGAPGYVSYLWNTGDTTNSIVVTSTGSYILEATDSTGCTYGDTVNVKLNAVPPPNPQISPNWAAICGGDSVLLDAGPGYFEYLWSNGDTTRFLQTNVPGDYTVTVWNGFGCSNTSDTVRLDSFAKPPKPVINQSGSNLTTSLHAAYQWYLDGSALPLAVTRSIVISQSGWYQVEITDTNGCSAISDSTKIVLVGIGAGANESVEVYPNPFQSRFTIALGTDFIGELAIEIIDIQGRVLGIYQEMKSGYHFEKEIDLGQLSNGIYYVKITAGDRRWIEKVVKE